MFHTQIVAADDVETRRREDRADLGAEVAVRAFGSTGGQARLINLSSRGFMARVNEEIGEGTRVWLTLPGIGRVSALVVWARGGRLGGEFSTPVDPLIVFAAAGDAARNRRNRAH